MFPAGQQPLVSADHDRKLGPGVVHDLNEENFTEEHEAICEMARGFAKRALAPAAAQIGKTGAFLRKLVQAMAAMGLLGMKIPEEYSGAGLNTRAYVLTMEEIAHKCAVASVYASATNSLGIVPLLMAGSEEQKKTHLPGVSSGERCIAFGLTEPGAGSDAFFTLWPRK